MAQRIEHRTSNPTVAGSSPAGRARNAYAAYTLGGVFVAGGAWPRQGMHRAQAGARMSHNSWQQVSYSVDLPRSVLLRSRCPKTLETLTHDERPSRRNRCAEKSRRLLPAAFDDNGAGDGNRTRVRSLEGFSSTIEPHPHVVGTTGFEPATSCSQSRRATRLRHVPTSKQFC